MYNFSQAQIFVFFFIIGVLIGVIFDIFRVLRKSFKTPDTMTYMQDIIFLFITGALLINSIIKLNNGEVRLYIFLAIFFGILIYSLTISKLCVIILYTIVNLCKKILLFPILIINKVIKYGKR